MFHLHCGPRPKVKCFVFHVEFPVAIDGRFAGDVIAEYLKPVKRPKKKSQVPGWPLDDYVDNS